jgi:hypothetical protein
MAPRAGLRRGSSIFPIWQFVFYTALDLRQYKDLQENAVIEPWHESSAEPKRSGEKSIA